MTQIDLIKELSNQGYGPFRIAEKLSIDRKTVAKYLQMDDFHTEVPAMPDRASKLDRFKETIRGWLEDDRRMRFKQRHTAKRVHDRLKEEFGAEYDCSYPIVQRYVKALKQERDKQNGFLELVWHPGEAQADFGEADLIESGEKGTFKYLTLSFPHSNGSYTQVFRGETAECVAQGLKDIFVRIGRVPLRIVFDNATGVGRRFGDVVHFADLFLRFKNHYGFSVSFCNPDSGHEKGNVENKIGYTRRNFFVPMPSFDDLEEFNLKLLGLSEADWNRPHYKVGKKIADLFEDDRKAMADLSRIPFEVRRLERIATDGYGKCCVDGRHWYSTSPELANREVTAAIGAHTIVIYDKAAPVVEHRRQFGTKRTDTTDYATSVERLVRHPNAWKNSGLRETLSEPLRDELDGMEKADLREALRILSESTERYGLETAVQAMEEAVKRGAFSRFDVMALGMRIATDGLYAEAERGPDLRRYDEALLHPEARA